MTYLFLKRKAPRTPIGLYEPRNSLNWLSIEQKGIFNRIEKTVSMVFFLYILYAITPPITN